MSLKRRGFAFFVPALLLPAVAIGLFALRGSDQTEQIRKDLQRFYRANEILDINRVLGLAGSKSGRIGEVSIRYSMVASELEVDWLRDGRTVGHAKLEKGSAKTARFDYDAELPASLSAKFRGLSGQVWIMEVSASVSSPATAVKEAVKTKQVRPPSAGDLKRPTFDIQGPPVLFENFNSYPISRDAAALLAGQGWAVGGGMWMIADHDSPNPFPLGLPAYADKALLQADNSNGFAFFGDENWQDYSVECALGRAATDNDEIRVWIRASGAGAQNPDQANGYMFFLNGGGADGVHLSRGESRLPGGARRIGLSRWDAGKEFVLISDVDDPLPENPANLSAADIETWAVKNGNGFSSSRNGPAEFFRAKIIVQRDRLVLLVSPKNPLDPQTALDPLNVGLGTGQVLKLEIKDATYGRGRFALQTISQIAWFDDIRIDLLK